jgi:Rrf2 family protein
MTISSRFAVAVHALTLLAQGGTAPVTSDCIATSVNTHPVVIRRLFGRLRQAGLVTSQPGARGGAMLARSPKEITLLDVFRAVEEAEVFSLHHHPPDPECHCGRYIQPVIGKVFLQVESAIEHELACVTIAQVLHEVEAAGSPGNPSQPASLKQGSDADHSAQKADRPGRGLGS